MYPVVWQIPYLGWTIPAFGLAMMVGFLLSIWWAARRAERSGADPEVILNCGFVALLAGVVGCRAMHVYHYWDQFSGRGSLLATIWAIVDVSKGGLEYYGGFILATVSVCVWLRLVEKVSLRWYMDIIAPSAALGLAFGRVGCFANGCCYGSTCNLPWAVTFPYGSPASAEQWAARFPQAGIPRELQVMTVRGIVQPISRESIAASDAQLAAASAAEASAREEFKKLQTQALTADETARKKLEPAIAAAQQKLSQTASAYYDIRTNMQRYGVTAQQIRDLARERRSLPVHPTQLYSTIMAGLIALFLDAFYWRRTRDGQIILTLLLVEPVTRYLLEIIRADNPVDTLGVFTPSQFIALCLSGVALLGLAALRLLPRRSARARLWTPPEATSAKPATVAVAAPATGARPSR